MKLSTRSQYGLQFLIYLGRHSGEGFIQLREIAEQEHISMKYLEQIVRILKTMGIIEVERGAKGGYKLAVIPSQINLYDVLLKLEGNLQPMACMSSEESCHRKELCSTHDVWKGLAQNIQIYFGSISLDHLIQSGVPTKPVEVLYTMSK